MSWFGRFFSWPEWHQQRCGVNPPPSVPKPHNPPPAQQPVPTIAERMHDGAYATAMAEETLWSAMEAEGVSYEFVLATDSYDNSMEVYFKDEIERPWEPSLATRRAMCALGFGTIYWNFKDGTEIRGTEPRRLKKFKSGVHPNGIHFNDHIHIPGVGYVDDTWTEAWIGSPYDCRGKL